MTRYTQLALMLCVAVAGTAVEARADCHKVRGSDRGDQYSVERSVRQAAGHGDWRAQRREHRVHHQPTAQRDVIRRLSDDRGRRVDRDGRFPPARPCPASRASSSRTWT